MFTPPSSLILLLATLTARFELTTKQEIKIFVSTAFNLPRTLALHVPPTLQSRGWVQTRL